MINHYINLVCWRAMYDLFDPERDVVWADSVSMMNLIKVFRSDAEYRPGTSVLRMIGPDCAKLTNWYFITARELRNVAPEIQIELPFIEEGEEENIPQVVAAAVRSLAPGARIGLGVSSPKQNRLAAALHEIRPDLEYYCLGAALFSLEKDSDGMRNTVSLSGSGFEWMRFLFSTPRRTLTKIWLTLLEIAKVLLSPSSRREFRQFVSLCEPRVQAQS